MRGSGHFDGLAQATLKMMRPGGIVRVGESAADGPIVAG